MIRTAPLALGQNGLAAALESKSRARAYYRALSEGLDPDAPGVLPRSIQSRLRVLADDAVGTQQVEQASDGTVKALIAFPGDAVETVIIPSERRSTVCVSSQVGCARGCRFCLTATMGLKRNLSAAEIVAQVVAAERLRKRFELPALTNIVFMGMGEPLDNLDGVEGSLEQIASSTGLGFGPRRITVSTVGTHAAAIRRAARLPARLAWSLHSADDETRRRLVPTARLSVAALRDLLLESVRGLIFVEIVLLDGINDDAMAAEHVVRLFDGIRDRVRINLLPMNPIGRSEFRASSRVEPFQKTLQSAGLFCSRRQARGQDTSAACGQLATKSQ